jgi:adenine phosphoribosyltransferase
MHNDSLQKYIRNIQDVPAPGVTFRDITPLIGDPQGFNEAVTSIVAMSQGLKIDKVVGIEARGFIIGAALALHRGVGFVPVRKRGKLPRSIFKEQYSL